MSVESDARHDDKRQHILQSTPKVQIFLKPIAPPAALGLAGFAGSTWITSSYIADWWGGPESPTIFFPFVGIFGGLAQFIAGIYGFQARDTLVTIINTLWGSFWIAIGILYAFVVRRGVHFSFQRFSLLKHSHRLQARSSRIRCIRTSLNWLPGLSSFASSPGRAHSQPPPVTSCSRRALPPLPLVARSPVVSSLTTAERQRAQALATANLAA